MFPAWNMLHSTQHLSHQETHHKLHPDQYADAYPSVRQTTALLPECSKDEENFQRVPVDDEHWASEEIPERTLCIHEHGLPHGLYPYPCPYANYQMPPYMDSLDLSDILDYEDYMVTSSDEDIPAFKETPY